MRAESANPARKIAAIASRQHGVVTREQLRGAGLSEAAIGRRVTAGALHRVHRGVYAVGHRGLPREGQWLAAVLACGERAVLSHRSAAELWRLLDPRAGAIDVSVPGTGGRRRRPGIRVHRRLNLPAEAVVRLDGIPVTTVARTLADLHGTVPSALHRRAVRQAEVLGLATGTAPAEPTRSELEDRFLALCRRHRLPHPEVNVTVGAHEVDFLWRPQRLVVETDGYRFHRGHLAFEHDHRRDVDLRSAGYSLLRLTHAQVIDEPTQIATLLRRELKLR